MPRKLAGSTAIAPLVDVLAGRSGDCPKHVITSIAISPDAGARGDASTGAGSTGSGDPRLTVFWILRIACACEFIGHGAFGIMTKREWVPYFGVAHIHPQAAYHWMPIVGTVDITLGLLTLLRPCRAQLLYMAAWGLWTAALRPLSGESGWELLERAPNFLVPFALLALMGRPWDVRSWFLNPVPACHHPRALPGDSSWRRRLPPWNLHRARTLDGLLRLACAGAFIGHGAYGVVLQKAGWYPCFASLGISAHQVQTHQLITLVGGCEMLLGAAALVAPLLPLLVVLALWKFGVELLWFPLAGKPVWELVERAANYAAPLALLVVRRERHLPPQRAGSAPAASGQSQAGGPGTLHET